MLGCLVEWPSKEATSYSLSQRGLFSLPAIFPLAVDIIQHVLYFTVFGLLLLIKKYGYWGGGICICFVHGSILSSGM